jgi:hypothetical protein
LSAKIVTKRKEKEGSNPPVKQLLMTAAIRPHKRGITMIDIWKLLEKEKEREKVRELLCRTISNIEMSEKEGLPMVAASVYKKKNSISLQFWGWAIVLNDDGTWFWEDTSGG